MRPIELAKHWLSIKHVACNLYPRLGSEAAEWAPEMMSCNVVGLPSEALAYPMCRSM